MNLPQMKDFKTMRCQYNANRGSNSLSMTQMYSIGKFESYCLNGVYILSKRDLVSMKIMVVLFPYYNLFY